LLHCNIALAAYLQANAIKLQVNAMSKQLAISACLSILAMAGLALAAPGITDRTAAHANANAGATTMIAAPSLTN